MLSGSLHPLRVCALETLAGVRGPLPRDPRRRVRGPLPREPRRRILGTIIGGAPRWRRPLRARAVPRRCSHRVHIRRRTQHRRPKNRRDRRPRRRHRLRLRWRRSHRLRLRRRRSHRLQLRWRLSRRSQHQGSQRRRAQYRPTHRLRMCRCQLRRHRHRSERSRAAGSMPARGGIKAGGRSPPAGVGRRLARTQPAGGPAAAHSTAGRVTRFSRRSQHRGSQHRPARTQRTRVLGLGGGHPATKRGCIPRRCCARAAAGGHGTAAGSTGCTS